MVLLIGLLYFVARRNDPEEGTLIEKKFMKIKLIKYLKLKQSFRKDQISRQKVCLNRFHKFVRVG
jgi:hypothetical protein